jgi:hypothetical protein
MKGHPFLRAYMAGVLLPTWVLLLVLGAVVTGHVTQQIPSGLWAALTFPMAVVPNLWGLWNVLYVSMRLKRRVSIGVFGAMLPLILVPAGVVLASVLELGFYTPLHAAALLPVVCGIYYLAWKFGVGFFNRVLELG